MPVGEVIWNAVCCRYGRRTILLGGLLMAGVMGMLRSYATNYIFFLVFEFLDPLFNAGLYSAAFILGKASTRSCKPSPSHVSHPIPSPSCIIKVVKK